MSEETSARAPVARFVRSVASALARRTAYRRTRDELLGLSDRQLSDIGLSRGDIHRVAMTGVRD